MAWPAAIVDSVENGDQNSNATLAGSSTLSVTAGDLIVVMCKWESSDTTISCADGGVNTYSEISFTGGHPSVAGGEPFIGAFWAVAATTATLTITVTWTAARPWRDMIAVSVHPDAAGTISLDGTPVGAGAVSTSIATGNITTTTQDTNCGLTFVVYGDYGSTVTVENINGGAADVVTTKSTVTQSEIWQRRYTTGFTGQGTATVDFNNWAAGIFNFKIVAAGGGTNPKGPLGMMIFGPLQRVVGP